MEETSKGTIKILALLFFGSVSLGAICGFLNQINAMLAGIGSVIASLIVNILTDWLKDHRKAKKAKGRKRKTKVKNNKSRN
ncbi:hypothetical protein G4O51_12205 [Candidatus Bathyarchaeota archaeon A05DMB-2]|jgi:hypothetical protein|nr:hypothetical protein [Candidatus Bathyarchaeota archaeon A05DMB-2]